TGLGDPETVTERSAGGIATGKHAENSEVSSMTSSPPWTSAALPGLFGGEGELAGAVTAAPGGKAGSADGAGDGAVPVPAVLMSIVPIGALPSPLPEASQEGLTKTSMT